jgi:hypothetical protein
MRSFWRRVAATLSVATVFQLGGCDFGALNEDVRAAVSEGVKATLVEISTIVVSAVVDDAI